MQTSLLLEMAAEGMGDRLALGANADGLTFATMRSVAQRAAAFISQHPIETVVYLGINSEAFPIALYGAGFASRPFAPLNYRLPDEDLKRLLARTSPSLAIVDDALLDRIGDIPGVTLVSRRAFLAAVFDHRSQPDTAAIVPPEPDDIAILLFTSGTSGDPKAAVLRHRHLASYVISTLDFMGASEDEAALISVPPYHVAGVTAVLSSTYLGRRMVQLDVFSPEEWIRLAREERITHAMLVPTMLERILEVLDADDDRLPHLRHLSYGGGRMPAATIERALCRLPHIDFVNAYGLTETSATISVLTPDDHRRSVESCVPSIRRRLGSVGRPLPSLELEIRDADGRALGSGHEGEVWVRGEQVSGEYLTHDARRQDGWFPTRDCGLLDDEGFLFINGRLDDVIVRGGENISPGEIEDVLRAYPGTIDAAVIGLPDNTWGERIVAILVTEHLLNVEKVRQWVRERLRSTKTPELILFREALPYNETGKLLRRVLKAELMASDRADGSVS